MMLSLFIIALLHSCIGTIAAPTPAYLQVTAVTGINGKSVIQCWQLANPFVVAEEAGVAGSAFTQLGATESASYGVISPGFDGGLHVAPVVQYVAFLSGLSRLTVPGYPQQEAWVAGGKDGLVLAADTADVSVEGHRTVYPSNEPTIGIGIRTKDGKVPPHIVVNEMGPCPQHRRRNRY